MIGEREMLLNNASDGADVTCDRRLFETLAPKTETRFRLVPKLWTCDDLERPWTADAQSNAERCVFGAHCTKL